MKTLLYILVLLTNVAFAQKDKFLSFELAGSGGIASFNYEQQLFTKDKTKIVGCDVIELERKGPQLNWRIGFSLAPVDKNNGTTLVFPLMFHALFGKNQHKLDVGIGQTFSMTTKGNFFLMMPASIGYRFQPSEKRYYLRLSYTPIISYLVDFQYQNWAGFTFGYRLIKKTE